MMQSQWYQGLLPPLGNQADYRNLSMSIAKIRQGLGLIRNNKWKPSIKAGMLISTQYKVRVN